LGQEFLYWNGFVYNSPICSGFIFNLISLVDIFIFLDYMQGIREAACRANYSVVEIIVVLNFDPDKTDIDKTSQNIWLLA
jgi:hypothetical protein